MTSQLGKQAITIQILPDISRSKSNQTMKFGQLIEYNKRNIFFQKGSGGRLQEDYFLGPLFVY